MHNLNDEQLNQLREQLATRRSELRDELREELLRQDQESYKELAGQVHDSGDESVADMLSDVNIAVVGKLIQELREVEAAQERMSEGRYGSCEDCGVEIPFERLKAYPSARRCITDQERHEKLYEEGKPNM